MPASAKRAAAEKSAAKSAKAKSGPNSGSKSGSKSAASTALWDLPEWNLDDLYAGLDDPRVTRDLDQADAET